MTTAVLQRHDCVLQGLVLSDSLAPSRVLIEHMDSSAHLAAVSI